MSGIEWFGERWAGKETRSALSVHLYPPDSASYRASWHLDIYHLVRPADGNRKAADRWISIQIRNLYFRENDWRRFENLEIKSTAAWHTAHEETDDRAQFEPALLHVMCCIEKPKEGEPVFSRWIGHDYIIRFGRRDGVCFPCEIDGWLIPEEEYYRKEPEKPEDVARFGEGEPNLRVLANVEFEGGRIEVPRLGRDPVPIAKRYAREAIACEHFLEPYVSWASRMNTDGGGVVEMPGWSSTVSFSTLPRPVEQPEPENPARD